MRRYATFLHKGLEIVGSGGLHVVFWGVRMLLVAIGRLENTLDTQPTVVIGQASLMLPQLWRRNGV